MVWAFLWEPAFAGPIVTDEFGGDSSEDVADYSFKLDAIDIVQQVRLITISPHLHYEPATGADSLFFTVYAETTPDDWELVWDSGPQSIGNASGFHDSPEVDLVLEAGKRYAIGWFMPDGNYRYWFDDPADEVDVGWAVFAGSVWSAENDTTTLPQRITNFPPDAHGYHLRLEVEILDADGDGFTEDVDCDDAVATTYPGAPELCDNIDNDCSGAPDDPVDHDYWYEDGDGDGFGDAGAEHDACDGSAPDPSWVRDDTDCLDQDPDSYPGAHEYCDARDNDCDGTVDNALTYEEGWADTDGDGFGDPDAEAGWCEKEPPEGVVVDNTDCDDTNADAYPGADEICDGIDDDCDGDVDEDLPTATFWTDADGDGFGDPALGFEWCDVAPPGAADNDRDCDDADPARFPDNPEVCDGVDNDCDGSLPGEDDTDGDGFFDCEDCGVDDGSVFPGAVEVCDGVDHDCDGVIPEATDCDPAPKEDLVVSGCGCAASPSPTRVAGLGALALLAGVARRRRR